MILGIHLLFAAYFGFIHINKIKNNSEESSLSKENVQSNSILKTVERNSDLSEEEKQLKRNRTRLRRNLLTLNYISSLESETESLEEVESFTEVINMKRRLQQEVIRNTRLVRHYNALL
jgi:hypothetical protein